MQCNDFTTNPIWQTHAILKIISSIFTAIRTINRPKIWFADANSDSEMVRGSKIEIVNHTVDRYVLLHRVN